MRRMAIGLVLAAAAPALAEDQAPPVIQVQAEGRVLTPPDHASINLEIRGEGVTADAATTMLAARRKAIEGGLATALGRTMKFQTGDLSLLQVRGRACDENNYNVRRLSSGDCAVVGYVASLAVTVETEAVKLAGTAAGLASRLEASNVRLGGYSMHDDGDVRRRATAVALANAHAKAQAIADGAGVKLGAIQRVQDGSFNDFVVTGSERLVSLSAPPAPPPPMAPVQVDLSPRPIETIARVNVTYLIER